VGQWINMEHYFSTVDQEVYGSGSKVYHNVVGRLGIMAGSQSDLRTGLAWQTVMSGDKPYHEPVRLLTLIEAPKQRIERIVGNHRALQRLYDNEWVGLIAIDPEKPSYERYVPKRGWKRIPLECSCAERPSDSKGG
ncbi:MAG TPA: putative inorganic carbon transporter subunit DabA, partial [Candidatus Binatia bacterium]|nr:putative inorganic carbon transporter subunit DabA [Candidatus Binatia bacterium]